MRLQKITIQNFKGLKLAEFSPTSFGCLVGENNAGKSSVLQAITFALKRASALPLELFYDRSLPVEFILELENVTTPHLRRLAEEHRPRLEELVIDGALTLQFQYKTDGKCEIKTERIVPTNPNYRDETIKSALSGKKGAAVKSTIATDYPEFLEGLADGCNITQAKEHLRSCIGSLPPTDFEKASAPLPSGISSSIAKLLPEPIYIPAVKNLGDDLKTSQSTSFGRLLGLLLEDMTPDLASINKALAELDGMLNRLTDGENLVDQRHEKVKALEALMETFLSENFPQVKLELRVPPPELKTILSSAQIFVDDGSRDLVDNKGDGIKRSLTFAILQTYVHHLAQKPASDDPDAAAPQPLIFLFEEPELYLHPRSQRVLFNTLARISTTHQVVVTTHSPLFFAPGVTAAFVRVAKKDAIPKPVGHLYHVEFDLNQTDAEVFRLARFENADAAFFSRRIILFEGESDDSYCKHVAKILNKDWDFDEKNIALSGKGNFAKFRTFFEKFGIEVKIVADLDAMFEGYHHLGGHKQCEVTRAAALQEIDGRIAALGIKAEPSARQIRDRVGGTTWRGKYETAKNTLREVQKTGTVNAEIIGLLDGLFTWEQEVARVRACREDDAARSALTPTLDELRKVGICVLSHGAIEDYYPTSAPSSGSKPERAIAAAKAVVTEEVALALSKPLGEGREPELVEIFREVFRDVA